MLRSTGKYFAAAMWMFGISIMLIYELWALINNIPGDMLSEAVWAYGQHPMIALAVGILIGHFWWNRQCQCHKK